MSVLLLPFFELFTESYNWESLIQFVNNFIWGYEPLISIARLSVGSCQQILQKKVPETLCKTVFNHEFYMLQVAHENVIRRETLQD